MDRNTVNLIHRVVDTMSGYGDYSDAYVGVSIAPPSKRPRDDSPGPYASRPSNPAGGGGWPVSVRPGDAHGADHQGVQQRETPQHVWGTAGDSNGFGRVDRKSVV